MSYDTLDTKGFKTPFTQYDLLAYFMPGISLLALIFIFETRLILYDNTLRTPITNIVKYTSSYLSGPNSNWAISLLFLMTIVVLGYVIGHIIASLSAIFIDRILVAKGIGYPYEYLLCLHKKRNKISKVCYRGTYFWLSIIIVLSIVMLYIKHYDTVYTVFKYTIIIIGISVLALLLIKTMLLANRGKDSIMQSITNGVICKIYRNYAGINDMIYKLIGNMININRGPMFPKAVKENYMIKFREQFGLELTKELGTNVYWLTDMYLAIEAPLLHRKICNWLNLYSFCRNMSTTLFLACVYCVLHIHIMKLTVYDVDSWVIWLPALFYVCSMVLLLRYFYLYWTYMSKFMYRAFFYVSRKIG